MYINKLPEKKVQQLFNAILSLKTQEECKAFFDDLCTMNELNAFIQRLEVARLLREGYTYEAIEEKTNAASATISRVNKLLHYGSKGYQLVLDPIDSSEKI